MKHTLALILALVPGASLAGWHGTTWHMPLAEAAVLPGMVRADDASAGALAPRLAAGDSVGGLPARALLYFDGEGRLARIALAPEDGPETCQSFVAAAGSSLGAPDRDLSPFIGAEQEWRREDAAYRLSWTGTDAPGACALTLDPPDAE